jgi:hypothetical protein
MSPLNYSAILSPFSVESPFQRRRSDKGMGVKGESERVAADACSTVDIRGSAECGESSKAFRNLATSDEAATAQDERAGC